MKGYTFHVEYKSNADKRKNRPHRGTVVAVERANGAYLSGTGSPQEIMWGVIGSVEDVPDGGVCGCSVSQAYLRTHCRRVTEAEAREIHPTLFKFIDSH